jgi:hypothetical protein
MEAGKKVNFRSWVSFIPVLSIEVTKTGLSLLVAGNWARFLGPGLIGSRCLAGYFLETHLPQTAAP